MFIAHSGTANFHDVHPQRYFATYDIMCYSTVQRVVNLAISGEAIDY